MCVLLDMYEERGVEKGISQGISQGIEEINTLYHCLLADHRMEDIKKQSWIQTIRRNCCGSMG